MDLQLPKTNKIERLLLELINLIWASEKSSADVESIGAYSMSKAMPNMPTASATVLWHPLLLVVSATVFKLQQIFRILNIY